MSTSLTPASLSLAFVSKMDDINCIPTPSFFVSPLSFLATSIPPLRLPFLTPCSLLLPFSTHSLVPYPFHVPNFLLSLILFPYNFLTPSFLCRFPFPSTALFLLPLPLPIPSLATSSLVTAPNSRSLPFLPLHAPLGSLPLLRPFSFSYLLQPNPPRQPPVYVSQTRNRDSPYQTQTLLSFLPHPPTKPKPRSFPPLPKSNQAFPCQGCVVWCK
ncbi:hypothetical protein ACH5RR_034237 [Cinchona calisaya]|uniref:Uncharacterized protein n=1 Tax=Cinchona calisaya TaxID=153742 RepID=A0ABD2YAB0_9GENT